MPAAANGSVLCCVDIASIPVLLLITHNSLAECQKAKLCTMLHFLIFMGHQVKFLQLFAFKSNLIWVSQQPSPSEVLRCLNSVVLSISNLLQFHYFFLELDCSPLPVAYELGESCHFGEIWLDSCFSLSSGWWRRYIDKPVGSKEARVPCTSGNTQCHSSVRWASMC